MLTFQNDPDTGRIFSQPPLISLVKRDENIANFLVRRVGFSIYEYEYDLDNL